MSEQKRKQRVSASFITGAIALAFLIIGYQTALFVHRAATLKILSGATAPDTVFVFESPAEKVSGGRRPGIDKERKITRAERHRAERPEPVEKVIRTFTPRTYESFMFNPNTVSVSDLCRLGFTEKQAESIDSYRRKGGRFWRRSDFAKSYVVSDTLFRRLEKFIDIPLVDINVADSAAFDALPGIGGYFAAKMVAYREKLGGYSDIVQLMEIYHLDEEKFAKFSDLIEVGKRPVPFRLWSMPADSLRRHPYVRDFRTANAIVLYRNNNPRSSWTVSGLERAGIIDKETATRLSRCVIE